MPSSTTVAAVNIELELLLIGTYIPYTPATPPSYASGGDPPHGDVVEDATITDIIAETTTYRYNLLDPTDSTKRITRSSLLLGVDTSNPHVQALLANLYNAFDSDITDALRMEALSHEP